MLYTEGTDYTGLNIALTLNPGERRCFALNIIDDAIAERDEFFEIDVDIDGETWSFTVTIIDNDGKAMGPYIMMCS